jgi:RNA polymerase sigma factor (sigma-70 family)
VARRNGARPEDAEDVVAQAMIRAVEHPEIADERLQAWLVTVTKRLVVDELRRRGVETERWRQLAGRAEVVEPGQSPELDACDRSEAAWAAAKAQELLPPRQAEALRLTAEGYDMAGVAAELGVHYRAAESLLARARRTLRAVLAAAVGAAVWVWNTSATVAGKPMAVALAAAAVAVAAVVAPLVVVGPEYDGPTQPARQSSVPAQGRPSTGPAPPAPPPPLPPPVPSTTARPTGFADRSSAPSLLPPSLLSPSLPVAPSLPQAGLPALPNPAPPLPAPPPLWPWIPNPELAPSSVPTPVLPIPGLAREDEPEEHHVRSVR